MSERVFEFEIPKLLKIQISGRNEGRVDRYLTRIGRDADDDEAKVAYTASTEGVWRRPAVTTPVREDADGTVLSAPRREDASGTVREG